MPRNQAYIWELTKYVDSNGYLKETNPDESDMEISTEILCMFFLLLIAISSGSFLHKSGHKYLQEAGLTTLIGMVAGYLLKLMSVQGTMEHIAGHFVNLFMILLLPPIIFESGYNMQKKPFFRNIGSVLAYSFLGTFIAIIFSSMMFYVTGVLGWSFPFNMRDSWAFGSLISATDPVAVLAIFKQMDADENLYAIVFGESIFNDAISIVMYDTVKSMADNTEATKSQLLLSATINFLVIFIGSILMGAMTALIVAFI
jgi:sodium/hydrogen exchanger 8